MPEVVLQVSNNQTVSDQRWDLFTEKVETLSDPLLKSIFKQGHFKQYDQVSGEVTVIFPLATKFYGEWLQETKTIWQPLLQEIFGAQAQCKALFEDGISPLTRTVQEKNNQTIEIIRKKDEIVSSDKHTSVSVQKRAVQGSEKAREKMVDVSDKETWKTANMLLDSFGGTVVEVEEKV